MLMGCVSTCQRRRPGHSQASEDREPLVCSLLSRSLLFIPRAGHRCDARRSSVRTRTEERNASNRARGKKGQRGMYENMDHHPPAVVAAPPAAGGAAAGGLPAGYWWQPVVYRAALARAHVGMAAAAAAFALFAFTLKPATFPTLPAEHMCDTTATEILVLRYRAWLLLLCAAAQAGAATAALAVVPPSRLGRLLACVANLLGLLTVYHFSRVVFRAIFATGAFCLAGHLGGALLIIHAILAHVFVFAIPLLWAVHQ